MGRLVELSHVVEHGMVTYRGLPPPVISDHLTREASRAHYAPGTEFQIGRLEMVANTGTYLDTPFHRFAEGFDIASLPLERVAGVSGALADVRDAGRAIGADRLPSGDLEGRAVLFLTGWSARFGTEAYFEGHPFLTREAAEALVRRRPALVGIDSLNIDDTADLSRPAHTLLLGAGIPIVEHLTSLHALPLSDFLFYAVPPRVKGLGTFPVRAFAVTVGEGAPPPAPPGPRDVEP